MEQFPVSAWYIMEISFHQAANWNLHSMSDQVVSLLNQLGWKNEWPSFVISQTCRRLLIIDSRSLSCTPFYHATWLALANFVSGSLISMTTESISIPRKLCVSWILSERVCFWCFVMREMKESNIHFKLDLKHLWVGEVVNGNVRKIQVFPLVVSWSWWHRDYHL